MNSNKCNKIYWMCYRWWCCWLRAVTWLFIHRMHASSGTPVGPAWEGICSWNVYVSYYIKYLFWCSLSCSMVWHCSSLITHEHSHAASTAIYPSKRSCCVCLIWPGLGPECAWGDSAIGALAWRWPPSASRGSPVAAAETGDRPQSFAPRAHLGASGTGAELRPTPSSDLGPPHIEPRKGNSLF